MEQSLLVACSFWTRNSQSNYNALKIFKTKTLCDLVFNNFLWQNELLMNLGEALDKFQKSIQESSGFSFSKLFADDLS